VTTTADKRRAGRLMKDARIMAMELIEDDVYASIYIAALTFPFVLEAARKHPRDYAAGEKARVVDRYRDMFRQLAAVTGGD